MGRQCAWAASSGAEPSGTVYLSSFRHAFAQQPKPHIALNRSSRSRMLPRQEVVDIHRNGYVPGSQGDRLFTAVHRLLITMLAYDLRGPIGRDRLYRASGAGVPTANPRAGRRRPGAARLWWWRRDIDRLRRHGRWKD